MSALSQRTTDSDEESAGDWTLRLGPHNAILLKDPYDLGPGTSHLQVPWVWQIPPDG